MTAQDINLVPAKARRGVKRKRRYDLDSTGDEVVIRLPYCHVMREYITVERALERFNFASVPIVRSLESRMTIADVIKARRSRIVGHITGGTFHETYFTLTIKPLPFNKWLFEQTSSRYYPMLTDPKSKIKNFRHFVMTV